MKSFIYRGNTLAMSEIKNSLLKLNSNLTEDTLKDNPLNYKTILNALSNLGSSISENKLFTKKIINEYALIELAEYLNLEMLDNKVKNELKECPGELKNIDPNSNTFQGYLPLGVIGHFVYSNNVLYPFLSFVDSLIAGNINIIITPNIVGDIYIKLFNELINIEPQLSKYIYLFPLDNLEKKDLTLIINNCNSIEVRGNEENIKSLISLTPPSIKTNFLEDRISFSYITKKGENKDLYSQLASDYFGSKLYNKSLPKIIYYECDTKRELTTFTEKVVHAIKKQGNKSFKYIGSDYKFPKIPNIDLTKRTNSFVEIPNSNFKLIIDTDNKFNTIDDPNTIIIKSTKRKEIINIFKPFSNYLGTVGLAADVSEIYDLTKLFSSCGIYKITNCGSIVENDSSNIKNYVKNFSIEQAILPKGIYKFDELKPTTLINEDDIPYKEIEDNACTSYSLIASGLDPLNDLCINIIPYDDIYHKIILDYEILKNINVKQIYIEENNNKYYVADKIFENNVNVIIGSSSYILNLLNENRDRFIGYNKIKKIFYIGDSFTPHEIDYLKNDYKIEIIKPANYSSVESGILGISCQCCDQSIFHVNTAFNSLDILAFNSNKPVGPKEEGRLVWKCKNPSTNEVITYDSGEIGKWISLPCKCGRTSPRFKVVGKKGDLFKIGEIFINYNKIKDIFSKELHYNGLIQINLDNYDNNVSMTILVEHYFNINEGYRVLYEKYPEYKTIIDNNMSSSTIINMDQSEFTYNNESGKIINVIDDRNK